MVNRFVSGERGINPDTAARLCAYLELELMRRPGRRPGGVKSPKIGNQGVLPTFADSWSIDWPRSAGKSPDAAVRPSIVTI